MMKSIIHDPLSIHILILLLLQHKIYDVAKSIFIPIKIDPKLAPL